MMMAKPFGKMSRSPFPPPAPLELRPGRKRFRKAVVKVVFFVLGRAMQSGSRVEHAIRREVAEWEEGFRITMRVLPHGPAMGWVKRDGRLVHLRSPAAPADLSINFKNLECAFAMLTPQVGVCQGFSEHRISVAGDLARCMSFVRCLNAVLVILYPQPVAARLVKRLPGKTPGLIMKRLHVVCLGVPFGR
jgi:hypothetical protein